MSWSALAVNLAATLGVSVAIMLVTFAVGKAKGLHRVVDQAWGLAFAGIAVATFALSAGDGDLLRRAAVTAMAVIWGVRLAAHIGLRSRGHGEDPRYKEMLSHAPGNRDLYALRMVYLLQAGAAWLISLPIQVVQYDPSPGLDVWLVVGATVWLIGFAFEAVGDAQLATFKKDPANRGKVLSTGLWRYSRHPNYFGDACVWWGLYLIACASWPGAATVLSPLLMTYFLAAKTGKPLMEAHLRNTKPEYADYVARTSGFVPLPPRRRASS